MQKKKNAINWYVFLPTLIVVGGAAILGLVSNKMLTEVSYAVFAWTLQTFAWLYFCWYAGLPRLPMQRLPVFQCSVPRILASRKNLPLG